MKIPRITSLTTILKRRKQRAAEKRKIQEQEALIEALRRTEDEPRRRPAMKYATKNLGPR